MQTALRKALAPLLKEAGPATSSLASRWPEIVGEKLAKVTEPLRVQSSKTGAILHIRAPSAAAPMLQHAAEHIMAKVSLATGAKVKSIKIVQTAAAAAPVSRKAAARLLTAEERTQLQTGLSAVQTSPIRSALERLGEAVITWGPRSER
jgi:hypothetical protein